MIIQTKVAFSGVAQGTHGTAERDGDLWKITWIQGERTEYLGRGQFAKKPLVDWFSDSEFTQFLERV